jgi:hypothetical protein
MPRTIAPNISVCEQHSALGSVTRSNWLDRGEQARRRKKSHNWQVRLPAAKLDPDHIGNDAFQRANPSHLKTARPTTNE